MAIHYKIFQMHLHIFATIKTQIQVVAFHYDHGKIMIQDGVNYKCQLISVVLMHLLTFTRLSVTSIS